MASISGLPLPSSEPPVVMYVITTCSEVSISAVSAEAVSPDADVSAVVADVSVLESVVALVSAEPPFEPPQPASPATIVVARSKDTNFFFIDCPPNINK